MKINQQVSILRHTLEKGVVAPTGWVDRQDELIETLNRELSYAALGIPISVYTDMTNTGPVVIQ